MQSKTRGKHLSFSAIENSVSNSRNKHIPSEKIYKKTYNKIYVLLRLTNTSKEGFASSVAYSNHKVGSATKLPLHVNKGITITSSCPKFNNYKNVKSFQNLTPQIYILNYDKLKYMITSIIIPRPLLFKSFLPPLSLHIRSKSPFKLLQ
jgi:hypothetical protein